jgi:DNA helicase-2/ATP-dependent DNA helicase PcrA
MNSTFLSQLQNLNPGQKRAVETIEGPVLVVAGPGTGKTQVLALRIANILDKTDAKSSDILCLTFTESGVNAMRKRLQKLIGTESYYINISTFHGFCNDVIQTFPDKFAFKEDLLELDDLNRVKILREIIDELSGAEYKLIPFSDKYRNQGSIIRSIQTLKREGVFVENFEEIIKDHLAFLENNKEINKRTGKPKTSWTTEYSTAGKNLELVEFYRKYNEKLQEKGFYDYEDMILFVINKFKEDSELLGYYQEKFLYILVDEYQDTNGAQNEILKLLGSFDSSPNIFAVGDDDQAIYRFQGANVENMLFFEKQFENVQTIVIDFNYRSSQLILDASDSLIAKNDERLVNLKPQLTKKLKAATSTPNNKIKVLEFNDDEAERRFLAEKIKELNSSGVNYSDIAVLFRKNSDGEVLSEYLVKEGIPIKLISGSNVLDELRVNQFINLLKIILYEDIKRDEILSQVLFFDFLNLPELDAFKIVRYYYDKNRLELKDTFGSKEKYLKSSLLEFILNEEEMNNLRLTNLEVVKGFADKVLEWKKDSSNLSLAQLVTKVAGESEFLNTVYSSKSNVEDINSVNTFLEYINILNRQNRNLTLKDFLDDLNLIIQNGINIAEKELDTGKSGVHLMTAHKAKGLEFPIVFIVNFYDKHWGEGGGRDVIKLPKSIFNLGDSQAPNSSDKDSKYIEIEDERRLVFVALTRAKENIFITSAKQYPSGNSFKETNMCKFLYEIDSKFIEWQDTSKFDVFDLEVIKKQALHNTARVISDGEKELLNHCLKDFKLSPSALKIYLECPLKFKYECLIQVPLISGRDEIMGTCIHYTLEKYMKSLMQGEKVDLEYVSNLYAKRLRSELLGQRDYDETLNEGRALLERYLEFYGDSITPPLFTEYKFNNLCLEGADFEPIPLIGKIDKIEALDENNRPLSPREVKIVDYKVSRPQSENQIKGLTKDSDGNYFRQLTFYKFLSDLDPNFKPSPSSPKYQVNLAELDFIKPDYKGNLVKRAFQITNQDIETLKTLIIDVMSKIRNFEFDGTEEHPLCEDCVYCKMKSTQK